MMKSLPASISSPSLQQAVLLYHQGNFDAVLPLFTALAATSNPPALVWHILGILQGKQGQFAQSAESLQKALALHPEFALAYFSRGANAERQGNLQAAGQNYRQALNLMPTLWKAP